MFAILWEANDRLQRFELKKTPVTIGRALDNDIVLADIGVSRHHAVIEVDDGTWVIKDLGSRNGIRVMNRFVTVYTLHDNDEVYLGNVCLRFVLLSDARIQVQEDDVNEFATPEGTFIQRAEEVVLGKGETEREISQVALPPDEILPALVEMAQRLIQFHSLQELLNQIMDAVFDHIPSERGFLMLWDDQVQQLVPKVVRFRNEDESVISISNRIATQVFNERVAILTLDAQTDPRFSGGDSIILHGIRSVMCVPLWTRDQTIGVIFVDTTTRTVGFEKEHLQLLTLMANIAAAAIEQARLQAHIQREMAFRDRLLRYHSPLLVEQLMSTGGWSAMLEPSDREVSVLFADMVGFSTRAEQMEPKQVAALLNDFFSELVDAVFRMNGTLDKFIGDAVMAFFGAPKEQDDHALRAVITAWKMRERIKNFNQSRNITPPLRLRIGINSGKAVAGDIGSVRRMEYTVLGNTVNVASRLETFVAQPDEIILGEGCYSLVHEYIKADDLGELDLKGIRKKIRSYRLRNIDPQILERYTDG